MQTELQENPPINMNTVEQVIDSVLQSASYAVQCTIHKTMGISPGSLVFNQDMILPILIIVDIQQIRNLCQLLTGNAAIVENNRRRFHNYHIGDQMQNIIKDLGPLDVRVGPVLTITNVHTNSIVSYLKNINMVAQINIRGIKPFN